MDLRPRFRELFDHDAWANRQLALQLVERPDAPARSLAVLAHVFAAERLWLARLGRPQPAVEVWPAADLARFTSEADALQKEWRAALAELDPTGFERSIEYTNSAGEPHTSRVMDVIEHVLQHSAYHRGQIASALREAGIDPVLTDLIHATRRGLLGASPSGR